MAMKLRPSPSVSATAFAPGTIKKGNDGNKYVIVVASNGVPRWQKVSPATSASAGVKKGISAGVKKGIPKWVRMKLAMKKVKKLVTKKSAVVKKVKPSPQEEMPAQPETPKPGSEAAAVDVCRRLTKGQLRISDLGKSPDTKGYVLLRDFAKKHMSNKVNYTKFQKRYCSPAHEFSDDECCSMEAMDPVLTTIAYLPGEIVDFSPKNVNINLLLFSDEADKKFFSLGVVNGYFRGDACNQFYHDFLVKKKYKPSQISAELKKSYKIFENLMVKSAGASALTHEHENEARNRAAMAKASK